jgi:hypothetical protein
MEILKRKPSEKETTQISLKLLMKTCDRLFIQLFEKIYFLFLFLVTLKQSSQHNPYQNKS